MDALTIEIDFDDILRQAEALGMAPDIIAEEMARAMKESLDTVEQAVVVDTPVNLGLLRGSIGHAIFGSPPDFYGEVSTPILYAAPVEFGRRPGKWPPIGAIRAWVVRKQIATGDEADQVAFLIARAIGRRGTKGAHMFQKGFEASAPMIPYIWGLALDRMVERMEA